MLLELLIEAVTVVSLVRISHWCPRNQHSLGILHSPALHLCTLSFTSWGVVSLTAKCVSVTYGTFHLLSKYVLLQPLRNRELRNIDIKSCQCVPNNWELPSCQAFIPFADLLDSVLQLVTLEEDDKYRLVHIIPLEQRKELWKLALDNYQSSTFPFTESVHQTSDMHSRSRMYLNNTGTVTSKQFSQPQHRIPALYLCLLKQNAPCYPLLILCSTLNGKTW